MDEKTKIIKVRQSTLQNVVNYLIQKPYHEVSSLIESLQTDVKTLNEEEPEKENTKEEKS